MRGPSRLWLALFLPAVLGAFDGHGLSELLRSAVAGGRVPGAVVAIQQHGKIVFEEAVGFADLESRRPMRTDDLFMLASSTKPFAATAILTLVDRGLLRLDDRVSAYFPAFPGASTVRQCLSHTAGIFGNDTKAPVIDAIRGFDRSLADAVRLIVAQPLAYEPSAKWVYGGASFCVAGRIVEMIAGKEFDAYMKEALLDPLVMRETMYRSREDLSPRIPVIYRKSEKGFEKVPAVMDLPHRRGPRPGGFVLVPGGIYSTPRDTIRFLQMHLDGGKYAGRRILSEKLVMEMRKKQTGDLPNEYGLGWTRRKQGGVGHGGAYGTSIWIDPDRDLVGIAFTQMLYAQALPFLTDVEKATF
jgi:CubicO group peptidase (beta-lactamase class C family)